MLGSLAVSDMGLEVGCADIRATFWPSLNQETKSTRQCSWISCFVLYPVCLCVCWVRGSDTKNAKDSTLCSQGAPSLRYGKVASHVSDLMSIE